jgi:hypothetical protein
MLARASSGADRASCGTAAVPTHQNAIELHSALLNVRHDDDGPPGLEQRRLDDEVFARKLVRLGLADDRDIEPARNAAEQFRPAHHGGVEHARFE